jgi:hypothetical protein
MLGYDTSKWDNLDHSGDDASGRAWTRLSLVMDADPMAQMFSDQVKDGIINILVNAVIGERNNYDGNLLNASQAYYAAGDALMSSPMRTFGHDVCNHFAGMATKAWYPEAYR